MSKGPGRIGQLILSLIATEPHGAWCTTDICQLAYPGITRVEKKHRVAVARTLRTMKLPGTWMVLPTHGELSLYDGCDFDSRVTLQWRIDMRHHHRRYDLDQYKSSLPSWREADISKKVKSAQKWRDASPTERIDMQIEDQRFIMAMSRHHEPFLNRIAELEQEKLQLAS
ncbi:hypothetical protein AS156_25745 [Bradyrhizobium macuxiense]|uniref:Uncharacterized protein n=1 Tax=Bradyrhizobium macuxiense TaxID=1755647 RepID=A0A109K5K9_9BRAD|nr:hypothetical protein [Bradyrhizobium macuxiense]KWV61123.1 hypothetical protein AS156_25745 [Bradyrhizobium macuxiense]